MSFRFFYELKTEQYNNKSYDFELLKRAMSTEIEYSQLLKDIDF